MTPVEKRENRKLIQSKQFEFELKLCKNLFEIEE